MPRPKPYHPKSGPTTWRVRFRLKDGTNTSETFTTRDEADAFCQDIDDVGTDEAVRLRTERDTHAGHITLEEVADEFFTWKAKKVRSDRTISDYRRDYTNWIKPRFGRRRANSITETEVQRWVDAMRDGELEGRRPAAPKSIADRHALLHGIFARGVRTKRIENNPCTSTDLPTKQKGLPKGLRPNEWAALHAALANLDPAAADLADGLLATGWRWSEVAAMAVGQLYDAGDALYASMDRVMRRNAAGQDVIVDEGKRQASVRRVKIDAEAAQMFRRRMVGKAPGDLVFTTPIARNGLGGNAWHYANYRRSYWDKAVAAANLSRKPTPHWLRHTHVVWMAMSGASLPELQSRIGHASITTTINVYGRMITDVGDAALNTFSKMRAAPLPQVDDGHAAQIESRPIPRDDG